MITIENIVQFNEGLEWNFVNKYFGVSLPLPTTQSEECQNTILLLELTDIVVDG